MIVRRPLRKDSATSRAIWCGSVAAFVATALGGGAGARAADLPVPCIAGSCGAAIPFVSSGNASAVASGKSMRIDQRSDKAILNWASFDVGAGNSVTFNQPGASSIALNRIHDASPSQIFGALEANGQIYLVNQNGLVFGNGSRVRTAGLIASTLDISDQNFSAGLLAPEILTAQRPALESDGRTSVIDAQGNPVLGPDGKPLEIKLSVQKGAQITTLGPGQRILLAGQNVENGGEITAPLGQAVIAAGEKIYLQASDDPNLRGLVVEVNKGGTAWNQLTGEISAAQGNVTLVGLTVNQDGRLSATTTVNANGSVRLLARQGVGFSIKNGKTVISAQQGGQLNVGTGSSVAVLPELDDKATAVDDQAQAPSTVELSGQQIFVQSGASIVAPGGQVNITAQTNPGGAAAYDSDARVRIHDGAVIDVSGTHATAPVTRNLVSVELRANELRDSPLQRDGALRGQTVVVDARVGTPLADVSGALKTIARGIGERTSAGGTIAIASDGDVMVNNGAVLDVSGGVINYTPGVIQTSLLMAADGRVVDIGVASKDVVYQKVINPTSKISYDRWGVTETINGPSIGRYDAGYTEGRDGGTLSFAAPVMALSGDFRGSTVTGALQRSPADMPAGALFRIGNPTGLGLEIPDYRAPSISIVDSPTPLAVADGGALSGPRTLELPTGFLTKGGFTRTEIYSNGSIEVALPDPLKLLPGSSFSLVGHRIDLRSDVIAPSGTVSLTAVRTAGVANLTLPDRGVSVADGVTVDVRGTWTNDALDIANNVATTQIVSPEFKDGGKIRLITNWPGASLDIGDDANLLASGGAWVQASGAVSGGHGGEITLQAGVQDAQLNIGSNTHLEAFGANGAAGGTFNLDAPRVEISNGTAWARPTQVTRSIMAQVQAQDEAPPAPEPPPTPGVKLGSALFSDFGFATFAINATAPIADGEASSTAFAILPGTNLAPRVRTLQLSADARGIRTGGTIETFSSVYTPLDGLRDPVSIAFSVIEPRKTLSVPSRQVGLLAFGDGATIVADPGSSIHFASSGGILLAGEIVAPSGTISASVATPSNDFDPGFLSAIGIDVLSSARLDVSGTTLLQPNDRGLLTGEVLGGGTIQLLADRGSVSVRSGAQLLANGGSGLLDLQDLTNPSAGYTRTLTGSAGGTIQVRAPESILLAGNLSARAGAGATLQSPGGTLEVRLTRERGFSALDLPSFPDTDRVLQLTDGQTLVGNRAPNGFGAVDARKVASGGFDSLTLEGGDRIEIDPTIDLHLARQLNIDSREVFVRGDGNAKLSAAYVSFGRTLQSSPASVSSSGAGTLSVTGDLIDITGNTSISGVSSALFASTGDIRLRGQENAGASSGSLLSTGDITLRGQRLYPTTQTAFSITSAGGTTNVVRIEQVGTSPGVPLSAAGSVTISARDIVQSGTLLAPFGRITLSATDTVTLAAGSVTSVSAGDQTIPFGSVSLNDWQYLLAGQTISQTQMPDRQVDVSADKVDMQSGSTIDLRGGGELYAYEWVPGTGGSKDALAPTAGSNLFAVIPSMRGQSGAYDPMEFAGAGIGAGDTVYLGGSALLAAGVYPLLPARYALLPGAVLVEARPEFANMAATSHSALSDGTTVVAGRRTFLSTGIGDDVYSGFAIRDGSYGRQLATYTDYKASTFFPARADRLELARAAIPADAAALSLNTGSHLDARGAVQTGGATGGLGATLNLTAAKLEITGSGAGVDADAVQVDSSAIERWNPARLTLGARLSNDGTSMQVVSDSVRIDAGVSLVHDEIIVAANEGIQLDSGARIASRAATSSRLTNPDFASTLTSLALTGDSAGGSAVLAASDLNRLQIVRPDGTDPSVLGGIFVDAGATLSSRSALLVDAPGGGELKGTLDGVGASWDLVSSRLSFSDSPQDTGLTITPSVANAIGTGFNARLASSGTIDFLGPVAFGSGVQPGASLTDLTIVASALRSIGDNNVVTLGATGNLTLEGNANTDPIVAMGSGTLHAQAAGITLGPGNLSILGFDGVSLDASGALRADGKGQLQVGGSLDIRAPVLMASTGANLSILGAAAVSIQKHDGPAASVAGLPGLGGALTITAPEIDLGTSILQPSGLVSLTAANALNIGAGGSIDVGGVLVDVQGRESTSPAGTIQLVSGGTLSADAGSTLNVAAGSATGGSLLVQSNGLARLDSVLRGGVGASVDLFAGSLSNFTQLNGALESGGFSGLRNVRVATGDLSLGAGETITARSVSLTADAGQVNVLGTINARSDNERSTISLFGSLGTTLGTGGVLRAEGLGEEARGGIVTLGTLTGIVNLMSGSTISTAGAKEQGRVQIRAPRVVSSTPGGPDDVAVAQLGSTFQNVSNVGVEAFLSYNLPDPPNPSLPATLNQTVFDGYAQDVAAFYANSAGTIAQRLGAPQGTAIVITPGLDLRRTGDLEVGSIDLSNWRFGAQPVNLTVRATGSIRVTGTVSDGFTVDTSDSQHPRVDMLPGASASMHFAAGAALGSANPLATTAGLAADFRLGTSAIVRTGTGDIGIAAARDIVYQGRASVYTAGNQAQPTDVREGGPSFGFADGGGQVSLLAGRDLTGFAITQSVGDWQPRAGRVATDSSEAIPVQWGVDIARFGFNAGSLGGGDVNVRAGRDVLNFSVSAANSGAQQENGSIAEYGGGVLGIDAVGDISSLYAHVTHGTNSIHAGGALGQARKSAHGDLIGSVFAIQNAGVELRARSGIALEAAFNPTALSQPGVDSSVRSFFYTYGDDSRLDAVSAAGDVSYVGNFSASGGTAAFLGSQVVTASAASAATSVLPPSVLLHALGGDILFPGGSGTLAPSDNGQLDLLASRDISGGGLLSMSDAAAGVVPSLLAPSFTGLNLATPGGKNGSGRHIGDTVPVEITAGRDLVNLFFSLAKESRVNAGRDIVDTLISGQNVRSTDVTTIFAGRDIRYSTGGVGSTRQIQLGGPGSLVVVAGRHVDLGFSLGITSIGATLNPALPSSGADISVIAGYGPGLRSDRFVSELVDKSDDYRKALIDYIARLAPDAPKPSYETARSQFLLMDVSTQLAFVSKVFFSELVKSGREVNQDPKLGFDRGYAAIDTLFPGSRPGANDPPSPYQGDILLSFSRIYSLSDGTISLFAPGGLLNVGLANPPANLQSQRLPSELGIVAQRAGDVRVFTEGDVLVNASRVFTLGGGDIAVWSTLGNIDAGRGAKSAISAAPPVVTTDAQGNVKVDFGAAVAGSGIRTIVTREDVPPGNVDLIAPAGIVNAGDAGIGAAGNLNVAAQQVVGLDNIQVGGSSTGVPAETSNLGAALSGASNASTSASSASSETVQDGRGGAGPAPLADTALGWLDVFVEGFGEEVCKPADDVCLQRSRKSPQ